MPRKKLKIVNGFVVEKLQPSGMFRVYNTILKKLVVVESLKTVKAITSHV